MGKKLSLDQISNMGKTIYDGAKGAVRKVGEEIARQMLEMVQQEAEAKNRLEKAKKRELISRKFRGLSTIKGSVTIQISETQVAIKNTLRRDEDGEYSRINLYSADPSSRYTSEVTFYKRPTEQEKKLMTVQKTCSTNKFQMVSTEFKTEDTWDVMEGGKVKKEEEDKVDGGEETPGDMWRRILNNLDRDKIKRIAVQSFVNKIKEGMGLG